MDLVNIPLPNVPLCLHFIHIHEEFSWISNNVSFPNQLSSRLSLFLYRNSFRPCYINSCFPVKSSICDIQRIIKIALGWIINEYTIVMIQSKKWLLVQTR